MSLDATNTILYTSAQIEGSVSTGTQFLEQVLGVG